MTVTLASQRRWERTVDNGFVCPPLSRRNSSRFNHHLRLHHPTARIGITVRRPCLESGKLAFSVLNKKKKSYNEQLSQQRWCMPSLVLMLLFAGDDLVSRRGSLPPSQGQTQRKRWSGLPLSICLTKYCCYHYCYYDTTMYWLSMASLHLDQGNRRLRWATHECSTTVTTAAITRAFMKNRQPSPTSDQGLRPNCRSNAVWW